MDKDNFTYPDAFDLYKTHWKDFDPDLVPETELEGYLSQNSVLEEIPNLLYLKDLYYEMGNPLSYKKVLSPIFDRYKYTDPETKLTKEYDGVFKEGQNNLKRYYHDAANGNRLDPNVMFSVKEDGPVTMQCTWRGTQLDDYFGYFYYPAEKEDILTSEDLWAVLPKYIFLTPDDITKTSDLTQRTAIKKSKNIAESDWQDMDGMNNGTGNCQYWFWQDDEEEDIFMRGRKYYLAYYGENYDQEPTYTFPEGIRIGYFIYCDSKQCIYFSDCKSEYELCRRIYAPNGTEIKEEGPLVRPFAAKFRMDNRTYVGFADESGDCDLNDVVFIAENVYPDPVDITPPELKEEDPIVIAQTWTLACEDLGSIDDVDFNDIVLDVAYVAGETTMTLTPRAAGGILVSKIYFREGNNSDYTELGEIHQLLSSSAVETSSGYEMLNTYKPHEVDPKSVKPITVNVPADFDFASPENGFLSRIKITTRQSDEGDVDAKEITAFTDIDGYGKIPQMMLLEGGWHWPTERTGIDIAYPEFKNWVKDHNKYDWTKSRKSDYTVSHRDKCSH